jgi:hypothetical protein
MHFAFTGIFPASVEEGLGSMRLVASHCRYGSTIARLQREKEEKKVSLTSDWQQTQYTVKDAILLLWFMVWILIAWDVLR